MLQATPRERRRRRSAGAPEQPVCTVRGRQLGLRAGQTALAVSLPHKLCGRFVAAEGLVCGSARPGGWACRGDHCRRRPLRRCEM